MMMSRPPQVELPTRPPASAAGTVHAGLLRLAVDGGATVGADLVERLTEAVTAEAELGVEGQARGVVLARGAAEPLDTHVAGLAVVALHAEGRESIVVAAVTIVAELVRFALRVASATGEADAVQADEPAFAVGVERAGGELWRAGALDAAEPGFAARPVGALRIAATVDADLARSAGMVETADLGLGAALVARADVAFVARPRHRAAAAQPAAGPVIGDAHPVATDVLVASAVGVDLARLRGRKLPAAHAIACVAARGVTVFGLVAAGREPEDEEERER